MDSPGISLRWFQTSLTSSQAESHTQVMILDFLFVPITKLEELDFIILLGASDWLTDWVTELVLSSVSESL